MIRNHKKITVPFFISHHGCPHTCSFCNQYTISSTNGSLPDRDEIIGKINSWITTAKGQPLDVAFFGGSFTALPLQTQDALLAPLQPLIQNGIISAIKISTRPDCISQAQINFLTERGIKVVELGIQSMNDRVLEAAERGHSAADSVTALRLLKASGMIVGAQLMPGLPEDTEYISRDSLRRVIDLEADFIRIYPVVVLEHTELARQYRAGAYEPLDLTRGVELCAKLLHDALVAGVHVTRIGLQSGDGLTDESILAGCWHPSLGDLVRSRLYFDLLQRYGYQHMVNNTIVVHCHPSAVSSIIGHKQQHLGFFKKQGIILTVDADSMIERYSVRFKNLNNNMSYNIITNLSYC